VGEKLGCARRLSWPPPDTARSSCGGAAPPGVLALMARCSAGGGRSFGWELAAWRRAVRALGLGINGS